MLFTCIVFCDGSRFQSLKFGRIFTLVRKPVKGCEGIYELELQLYEGSDYAEHAKVVGKRFHPVSENRPIYILSIIALEKNYQRLSLGSLLVYIINTEARKNGGEYFYIDSPELDALGFYLRLGFIPDPDELRKKDDVCRLSTLSGSTSPYLRNHYLNEKLVMIRDYVKWRGYTKTINTTLGVFVREKFKFLEPE